MKKRVKERVTATSATATLVSSLVMTPSMAAYANDLEPAPAPEPPARQSEDYGLQVDTEHSAPTSSESSTSADPAPSSVVTNEGTSEQVVTVTDQGATTTKVDRTVTEYVEGTVVDAPVRTLDTPIITTDVSTVTNPDGSTTTTTTTTTTTSYTDATTTHHMDTQMTEAVTTETSETLTTETVGLSGVKEGRNEHTQTFMGDPVPGEIETTKVEDAVDGAVVTSYETDADGNAVTVTTETDKSEKIRRSQDTVTEGEIVNTHVDKTEEAVKVTSGVSEGSVHAQLSGSLKGKEADYNVPDKITEISVIEIDGNVKVAGATGASVTDGKLSDCTKITDGSVTVYDKDGNVTYTANPNGTDSYTPASGVECAAFHAEQNADGTYSLVPKTKEDGVSYEITNPATTQGSLMNPLNLATYVESLGIKDRDPNRLEAGEGGYVYSGEAAFNPNTGMIGTPKTGTESDETKRKNDLNPWVVQIEDAAEGVKTVLESVAVDTGATIIENTKEQLHLATAYVRGLWTQNENGVKSTETTNRFEYYVLSDTDIQGDKGGNIKVDGKDVVLDKSGSVSQDTSNFTSISGNMALTIEQSVYERLAAMGNSTGKGLTTGGTGANKLEKIFFKATQAGDGTWHINGDYVSEDTALTYGGHYFVPYVLKYESDTASSKYQVGYHYDGYLYFLSATAKQLTTYTISQDIQTVKETLTKIADIQKERTIVNRYWDTVDYTDGGLVDVVTVTTTTPPPTPPTPPVTPPTPPTTPPTTPPGQVLGASRPLEESGGQVLGATRAREGGMVLGVRRVPTGDESNLPVTGAAAGGSLLALVMWALN